MEDSAYQKLMKSNCFAIVDAAMKCEQVFRDHKKALVSISGGADSDVILDICERVRQKQPIEIVYGFFNTGIEYRATLDHLSYLEERYGIEIVRFKAEKSVPRCCKEYGQPFASKYISMMIARLQNIGFEWDDSDCYDELWEKYGACRSGLRWWTNDFGNNPDKPCKFDIGYRRHLKEFMVENHPWFRISPKCCDFAKKRVAKKAIKESGCDLTVVGVRKSEGGGRAIQNKCFDKGIDGRRARIDRCSGSRTMTEYNTRSCSAYGIVTATRCGGLGAQDASAVLTAETCKATWTKHCFTSRESTRL